MTFEHDPRKDSRIFRDNLGKWLVGVSAAAAGAAAAGSYVHHRRNNSEISNSEANYTMLTERYPDLKELIEGNYPDAPSKTVDFMRGVLARTFKFNDPVPVWELKQRVTDFEDDKFETNATLALKALATTHSPLVTCIVKGDVELFGASETLRSRMETEPLTMPRLHTDIRMLRFSKN